MASPVSPGRNGHLVAFEGPSELVLTQLRLLPASPNILVLPSIQHYMKDNTLDLPFDARQLIFAIHKAAQARHAEALEFLRAPIAAANDRRLVFMHGGTAGAHVTCLSAIMEHQTGGNVEAADLIFSQLVSTGIAGLLPDQPLARRLSTSSLADDFGSEPAEPAGVYQDEQDSWEPYSSDEDNPLDNPIIRAMRAADELYKQTEFLQPASHDIDLTVKLVDIPPRHGKRLDASVVKSIETLHSQKPPSTASAYSQDGELPAETVAGFSAGRSSAGETTPSPTASRPSLELRIPSPPIPRIGHLEPLTLERPRTADAALSRAKENGMTGLIEIGCQSDHGGSKHGPGSISGMELLKERTFGDGKDWGYPPNPGPSSPTQTGEEPFGEVLPLLEDVVFHFSTETVDELLDLVFERFRDGDYPGRQSPQHLASQPIATGPQHFVAGDALRDEKSPSADGDSGCGGALWIQHGLPTPGHSRAPSELVSASESDKTFYSLHIGQETAISVQNFLRSLLASNYHVQDHGHKASSATDPETVSLWKPLQCDASRTADVGGGRRVDMILTIGAEKGVNKDRVSELTEHIEMLGSKGNGPSRSGRLDLRFLIFSAMQAFTAQKLTKQTQTNPFSDRNLLAALIIPHLETYLSTNPHVRFLLIKYEAEHFETISALQNLIGTEMMKVVGIVHGHGAAPIRSSISAPHPAASRPSTAPQNKARAPNPGGLHTSKARSNNSCSFSISKASFFLAATASALETAAFIAAIRESLISISEFYIPDHPLYQHPWPKQQQSQRPATQPSLKVDEPKHQYWHQMKLTDSTGCASPFQHETSVAAGPSLVVITPPSSPADCFTNKMTTTTTTTTSTAQDILGSSSGRAKSTSPSPAAWLASTSTYQKTISKKGIPISSTPYSQTSDRHYNYHHRHHPQVDGAVGGEYGDDAEEEEEDDEERRLMPMYLRRQASNRDGKKALKWLGLV